MNLHVPRVVFVATGQAAIDWVDVPDPGPDQIRVRATRTQVSAGSERNALDSALAAPRPVGYTSIGVVESVGGNVQGYAPGDRVLTMTHHQGAVLVDVNHPTEASGYAGHIPAGVSDEEAAFAVLGDVALHGVRRAQPYLGESVAVFGQGVVGQLTAYFAAKAGADPVIAIDLDDQRLELARTSGATHTVNAGREDAVQAVKDLTHGGARVTFMVTRTPKILPDCLRATAAGGTVCLSGSPPGMVEIRLQEELLRNELNIIGNYQRDYPILPYHRFLWTRPANRAYVLQLIAREELSVDHLISHVVPYLQAPEMYAMIDRGPAGWMSVFFDWSGAS
ncbi:MAG: zinc-binding alcohol dehydrogenase [Actinobacteria bacterium]|nr:zinc-binding alcohol dehydrogenase [Actinomycetota bacterium]